MKHQLIPNISTASACVFVNETMSNRLDCMKYLYPIRSAHKRLCWLDIHDDLSTLKCDKTLYYLNTISLSNPKACESHLNAFIHSKLNKMSHKAR